MNEKAEKSYCIISCQVNAKNNRRILRDVFPYVVNHLVWFFMQAYLYVVYSVHFKRFSTVLSYLAKHVNS